MAALHKTRWQSWKQNTIQTTRYLKQNLSSKPICLAPSLLCVVQMPPIYLHWVKDLLYRTKQWQEQTFRRVVQANKGIVGRLPFWAHNILLACRLILMLWNFLCSGWGAVIGPPCYFSSMKELQWLAKNNDLLLFFPAVSNGGLVIQTRSLGRWWFHHLSGYQVASMEITWGVGVII